MSTATVEERLTALEAEVEGLKQRKQDAKGEEPRGWQRVFGRFADMPGFDEAVQFGREWRETKDRIDEGD